jgi:sec-independent protein translocase protein TatA
MHSPLKGESARSAAKGRQFMFGSFGLTELLIILAIVIVIFGGTKIPKLGKGLGEGIRNFKLAIRAAREEPEEKPAPEKNPEKGRDS